ncbi:hypothetical protein GCM10010507_60430 [Streptomyces cinnamoneus]|uniref:Uncharacterized protein n=1 Tax=Streptomyces cinnamoneus TaxID=53446 RepID=A0A918TZV2_STRCJ|nr:hypothetical protein GCM10010507_60430 [Streptomyces cinnamoneus]
MGSLIAGELLEAVAHLHRELPGLVVAVKESGEEAGCPGAVVYFYGPEPAQAQPLRTAAAPAWNRLETPSVVRRSPTRRL